MEEGSKRRKSAFSDLLTIAVPSRAGLAGLPASVAGMLARGYDQVEDRQLNSVPDNGRRSRLILGDSLSTSGRVP